jgi:hypothetical protein
MIILFSLSIIVAGLCVGFLAAITFEYAHRVKRSSLPRHMLITKQEVIIVALTMTGLILSALLLLHTIPQIIQ